MGALLRDLDRAASANDRLADSSDRAAKKGEDSANKLAKGGAVIALGLGVAIAKFAEFDSQMSAVGAATGKTGEELDSLRDAAVRAGADTQYSATQAASAITELSKAGLDATDILGGGLTGALNLAAAGQMDTADAAETMATALAQFNLEGAQASHVADLLAAGAGKAQGSVSDMGMALKQAGLVANQTGLSVEETTTGLTAFANAGLIGSDAGTAFKSMLQRLTPQSDEAAALMEELGISAYDAQGNFIGLEKYAGVLRKGLERLTPQQRNAALSTIFGSDAVRAAAVIYDEGATGIAKWTEEVNQQGYAAKQAAALTDNLKGDVERLGGAFDTALIQGGSGANDTLRSLVQTTESLVEVVGQIPGPVLAGAAAFGAVALVGPKVSNLARTVTGPLTGGLARFREEMALHRALATQVTGGYQRLGDESVVASGKVSKSAVAMSAARSTIGGLKGAASGLVGALGGPWGIALAGATVAIGIWAQRQAEARAAADALNATVEEQTGKFTKGSHETVLSAFSDALSPEDTARIQELGVNLADAADAALKGGPAFTVYRENLRRLAEEKAGVFGNSDSRLLDAFTNALDVQAGAVDAVRVKQELLNDARNRDAVATSRQAGSAAAAEGNMDRLGGAIDGVTSSSSTGQGAVDGMAGSIQGMGGDAEDAETQLQGLMDLIDTFAGGERALRASERAFRQSVRDAVEGATDKGGNDPDAVKAQARATEDLRDAEDRLAKARKSGKKDSIASAQKAVKDAQERLADANQRVADTYVSASEAQDVFEGKLDEVAETGEKRIKQLITENADMHTVTAAYEETRAAIIKALNLRGIHGKAAEDEADKIFLTRDEMLKLNEQYEQTPGQVATSITTPGLPEAKKGVEGYWEVINGVPTFKPTTVTTPGIEGATSRLQGVWEVTNGIPRFIPVTVAVSVTSSVSGQAAAIFGAIGQTARGIFEANGGLVTAYAGGGIGYSPDVANAHVAHIAPAGSYRVFGEKETQGEGYVPLANDWRRPRAKAITQQIVSRFGGDVTWHAAGSITASSLGGSPGLTAADVRTIVASMPRMTDRDIDRTGAAFARRLVEVLPNTPLNVDVADVQAAAIGR
jgi:TP901 family phage tail tape measure protein